MPSTEAIKFSPVFLTGHMRCHVLASFWWKEDPGTMVENLPAAVQDMAHLPPEPWRPLWIQVLLQPGCCLPSMAECPSSEHRLRLQRPQRQNLAFWYPPFFLPCHDHQHWGSPRRPSWGFTMGLTLESRGHVWSRMSHAEVTAIAALL